MPRLGARAGHRDHWLGREHDAEDEASELRTRATVVEQEFSELGLNALWHFQAGRGVQEKTLAELKSGYAFASIPTQTYRANTAWQKLNILAHNIMTSFQLATIATEKPRTRKRTTIFLLRTIATLRFEWLNRAARLLRPAGSPTLRLVNNRAVREVVTKIDAALDQAA